MVGPKFQVGDEVRIVSRFRQNGVTTHLNPAMKWFKGMIYIIDEILPTFSQVEYRLRGSGWVWNEAWLLPVENVTANWFKSVTGVK